MKKKYSILIAVFICLSVLSGCCLSHEWQEADCESAKICLKCGKTDGEALGHRWTDATCEVPKTCTACGATEGEKASHNWLKESCFEPKVCLDCGEKGTEPLGHDWLPETCEEPRTCAVCGATEGSPMGHYWMPATCISPVTCYDCGKTDGTELGDHLWSLRTTEAPMTCDLCGATRGEPLQTDPRFKTEASKCVFGPWKAKVSIPLSQLEQKNLYFSLPDHVKKQQKLDCWVKLYFYTDARMNMEITPDEWKKISFQYQPDILHLDFGVYYVEDGVLYIAMDWEQEMTPLVLTVDEERTSMTLEGNVLGPTKDDAYRKGFHKAGEHQFYSAFKQDADLGTLTFDNRDHWE